MKVVQILIACVVLCVVVATSVDAKVYAPQGKAPTDGWPVVVYLQSHGVTHDIFDRFVKLTNQNRMAVVTVHIPGVGRTRGRKPSWEAAMEPGHALVQTHLQSLRPSKDYDLTRVYLAGAANGGTHAALAVMAFPEYYCGALVASPAVATVYPDKWDSHGRNNPMFLMYSSSEAGKESVTALKDAWRKAGAKLREHRYPGVRGDLKNWESAVRSGLQYIQNSSRRITVNAR